MCSDNSRIPYPIGCRLLRAMLRVLADAGTYNGSQERYGSSTDLAAILLAGCRDVGGQQMPQDIHGHMHFRAAGAFGTIVSARVPLSGVDCRVRLSKIAAEGSALRPCASRKTARMSWTMASKTPAFSQRRLCWYTVYQGGRSCGIIRHTAPARTIQRRP